MTRAELIENVVMVLCIPTLWPVVRSVRTGEPFPPYYDWVLIGVVVVLGFIMFRRVERVRTAFKEQQRRKGRPPTF